ncbi:class I SAM-dependent methyltransferase [Oxynema aestuarii]|uniref:class I SAM-dependent methyltransferase n=1 Tax=Oxynema aestuarii TaxID=2874213 RepID=UPI001FE2AE18|nr:class I SAM-dependent methyltransferase [Oxynema aestuarii]
MVCRQTSEVSALVDFPETADIETSSEDYARRFSGKIGDWLLQVQERATLDLLAPYPNARILDVGGGHGQLAEPLTRRGYRVTVFGSDAGCKRQIAQLCDRGECDFQVGNILDLPYGDRAFDIVISYRLLAHVKQWQKFLTELSRVADRAVIIDYPSLKSINAIAPYLFQLKRKIEGNTRPFACFQETDLLEIFQACGFEFGDRYPQFCLPMVIHRSANSPRVCATLEQLCRQVGLTDRFGSPVLLKLTRSQHKFSRS